MDNNIASYGVDVGSYGKFIKLRKNNKNVTISNLSNDLNNFTSGSFVNEWISFELLDQDFQVVSQDSISQIYVKEK